MFKPDEPLMSELMASGLAESFSTVSVVLKTRLLTLITLLSAVLAFVRPATMVRELAAPAIVTLFAVESVRLLMVKFAPRTVLKLPAPVAAKVTCDGVLGGTTVLPQALADVAAKLRAELAMRGD